MTAPRGLVRIADFGVSFATASTPRYAERESGDMVRIVERPDGGISIVVADGQGHGRAARSLATFVAGHVATMIATGMHDSTAISGANDALFTHRFGQVSTELLVLSVGLGEGAVDLFQNAHVPAYVLRGDEVSELVSDAPALGIYRIAQSTRNSFSLQEGLTVVAVSDGITTAGLLTGKSKILASLLGDLAGRSAVDVVEEILSYAVRADDGRPRDDMTVACIKVGRAETVPSARTHAGSLRLAAQN